MAKKRRVLSVDATSRFVREYGKASATLRDGARREVALISRRAIQADDWLHHYDTVAGLGGALPGRFIELEIGSGPRLIAYVEGRSLTLVALGDHDIVSRLKRRVRSELSERVKAPAGFVPGTLEEVMADLARSILAGMQGRPDTRAPLGPEVNPN